MPKLTERLIERLECPAGKRDRLVFDTEQRGLAVRIMASGTKSYLAQYSITRRKYRVPLGAATAISLGKARDAACAIMGKVAMGENPAAARRAQAEAARAEALRARLTLGKLVDDWRRLHLAHRRESYAGEAVRVLTRTFENHWGRPADRLDRETVVRVIDDLSPSVARVVVSYGRACFAWAVKRGSLPSNPFQALPISITTTKRDRVLTDEELAAVWNAAGRAASTAEGGDKAPRAAPFPAIIRMLALTGQRRNEVSEMAWPEISADSATWAIPGERTKNGLPHVVPLSPAAQKLIAAAERDQRSRPGVSAAAPLKGLVFPGEGGKAFGNWTKMKTRLDKDSGVTGWRVHDLRRTLATGLQRLGVRLEVTEAVLNHVGGSKSGVVGVYQRHEWAAEKRAALEAWADRLLAAASGKAKESNVVDLRRA